MRYYNLLFFLIVSIVGNTQFNLTWVGGSNMCNAIGNYGTQGMSATTNQPGARQNAASWTGADNSLWLFGGQGYNASTNQGYLADLWKFDCTNQTWTWVSGTSNIGFQGNYQSLGTASSSALPAARQNASSWIGNDGCLYIFGGQKSLNNNLNDLWKFNPSTSQWTWMGGSSTTNAQGTYGVLGQATSNTIPPARYGALFWKDGAGKFWLFGGQCYDGTNTHRLNDMWCFDPQTTEWTWVSGSNQYDNNGVYGTQNSEASANIPGARQASTTWTDTNGNLWLFGGYGYPATGVSGYLSDVWKYNISTSKWTWIAGTNVIGSYADYGTVGVETASNHPGARQMSIGFTKDDGRFGLMGGWGYVSLNNFGRLNDIWTFNPSTGNWTWEAGQNHQDPLANYGVLNTTASSNISGGRRMANCWQSGDSVWFFGGNAIDAQDSVGVMNDIWKMEWNNPTNAIGTIEQGGLLSPNPASNYILLPANTSLDHFEISDLNGRKITQFKVENGCKITFEGLTKGMYFIQTKANMYRFIVE